MSEQPTRGPSPNTPFGAERPAVTSYPSRRMGDAFLGAGGFEAYALGPAARVIVRRGSRRTEWLEIGGPFEEPEIVIERAQLDDYAHAAELIPHLAYLAPIIQAARAFENNGGQSCTRG